MHEHIKIVGTSHISSQSVRQIKKAFKDFEPDIVGVELDKQRLHAMLHNLKPNYSLAMVRKIGIKGFIFAVLGGLLQKKLGSMVGMKPGSDMLCAANLAKEHKKPILLLDRNIQVTLRRLKLITFREKMRFVKDLVMGFVKRKKVKINLHNVPSAKLIETLLGQLKDKYPTLYRILVDERNEYMAKRLKAVMKAHPEKKILVVIGAGHRKGFEELVFGE